MASKMCVSVILLTLSCLVVGKGTAAAASKVIDVNGKEVRHGQDHSFDLLAPTGIYTVINGPFSFGLGRDGSPVRTGTNVIMVAKNNTLMACINGKVQWAEPGLLRPEEILYVQPIDTAHNLYILEIGSAYVTDVRLSSCIPGVEATPFNFQNIDPNIATVAQA